MKTIGVLGGLGPQATMAFEAEIHRQSQQAIPAHINEGYPPMVTLYVRHTPVLTNATGIPLEPLTLDPRMLDSAAKLGKLVDFLTMPCNTPHFFLDQISQAAGCEVLSIVDAVVAELDRRQPAKVGLIGLGVPKVYSKRFANLPFEILVAPKEQRDRLDLAILALIEGNETEQDRQSARTALDSVREPGADVVVLGCTEIPLLLGEQSRAEELIDPSVELAKLAVQRALDR